MTDHEAYKLYRYDRIWYNKFFVASILGYRSGLESIPESGYYVVKPIINLDGCGIGASMGYYQKGHTISEECFWSEVFTGRHITIDYTKINGVWQQGHTFEGFKEDIQNLLQFCLWRRVDYKYDLPTIFGFIKADKLNIEIIDDKIIEVHLRHNTDPVSHDFFIPIWNEDQPCPENCVRIQDDVEHPGRLGFYVKEFK